MHNVGDTIYVNNKMQQDYHYKLDAPMGCDFPDYFTPKFSPKEMLAYGVFEGKYLNDCQAEYPSTWFKKARLSSVADVELNYFKVKSRQPLSVWRYKRWIFGPDPRGWFEWYCRYYMGRRVYEIDELQIKRWRAFVRHSAQVKANCEPGNIFCRPRQRQALLQWSHDPFI